MDNHHKEVGKLVREAWDAKAEVDELCEMMEGVRDRLKPTEERVRNFEDWYDGQEGYGLRSERALFDLVDRSPDRVIAERWLRAAFEAGRETLLSENKALRHKGNSAQVDMVLTEDPGQPEIGMYDKRSHVAVEINQFNLLKEEADYPQYNPETHVAMPRKPTIWMISEFTKTYDKSLYQSKLRGDAVALGYAAMLTAASQEEE